MNAAKPIDEILALESPEFGVEFYHYLSGRRISSEPLTWIEEEAYLLLTMLLDIEMEGFVDLFYQLYTLRECAVVEATLRKLSLNRLADLFAEAKEIYTDGRQDISEKEYRAVDWSGDDPKWQRFEAIGEEILAPKSEIYLIEERVMRHAKAHASDFRDWIAGE